MKKLLSVVVFVMTVIALSTAAFADIAPLPRPEPEAAKSPVLSTVIIVVIIVVVIAAVAVLVKLFHSKKK